MPPHAFGSGETFFDSQENLRADRTGSTTDRALG
jgi:hypothetical protein